MHTTGLPSGLRVTPVEDAHLSQVTAVVTSMETAFFGRSDSNDSETLARYLRMIQVQRQDFNGRVLTVRRDDMRAIAAILGVSEDLAEKKLDELGLRLG